ncbi:MAG: glycosyltransferase family 9 protein [Bryobacteraceae bacterium]
MIPKNILVIRLGAMGDILHALPAVASLKKSFPASRISWLVAPRWLPLFAGNPSIDELIPFKRGGIRAFAASCRRLRGSRPDLAIDFQGLVQSALCGRIAQPGRLFGFDRGVAREPLAAFFYTHRTPVKGPHRIERNLQLAAAAGAADLIEEAWIPPGREEGSLPSGPFVLTSPFAGWKSKEWPIENYEKLAFRLRKEGLELVANVPAESAAELRGAKHLILHTSSLAGLIAATRRATAVLGLDSGPLHLAAALRKPGVGLFGPTDPAATGPFGGSMSVLRASGVATTYKRGDAVHESMKAIAIDEVAGMLLQAVGTASVKAAAISGQSFHGV